MRTWIEKLGKVIKKEGESCYSEIMYNGEIYYLSKLNSENSLHIMPTDHSSVITLKIYEEELDYLDSIFIGLREKEKQDKIKEYESL